MLRTRSKFIGFFCCLGLLLSFHITSAQETSQNTTALIKFVQELERTFEIKFSYVDVDLEKINVIIPKTQILSEIIESITAQTNLTIAKLNDRYYTITKTTLSRICGIVLDNYEQNTVAGANIEVLGSERSVMTDSLGRFYLKNVPHKAVIQIKHIGFKTLFVNAEELVSHSPCQTLLLSEFYQQLEEVVVYDFLTKGLVKNFDGSITMNTEAFGILPGLIEPDVLQSVQALPGVKSIDETVSDINIRGGSNDQNLILWDGIKMYQSGHFFGLISAFNPYLTDKINLIKNGTSARYGDGVSGIIDMRTKNELTDEYYAGAGFNFISGDAFAQIPLGKKIAFQFSGRRALTDFIETATFSNFFKKAFLNNQIRDGIAQNLNVERNDQFYFYDFTAKLLYDINEKQKLRFSFININNFLNYNERDINTNTQTSSELNQTNFSFGSSLKSNWTNKFSTFLNSYYTNYNLDAINIDANGQQIFFQNNNVIEKALQLSADYKLTNDLTWSGGYQLIETSITNGTDVTQPPFSSTVTDEVLTQAFFTELGYVTPNSKLRAKGGIRLSLYNNSGLFNESVIEPRLNINYALTKAFNVTLLGEIKSQAVNQVLDLEQNFLGIEKRRWILSNGQNLPITKSQHISAGINYDTQTLYVGLEGFYKEVDGISTATQGFQNQNQFNGELGKYAIKGIEFLINKKTNAYSLWASYAYNLNNYTFEFQDIGPTTFPNNLDIRHTATFAGTYTFNKLKFGLGLNYRSGKPFTEPDLNNPIDNTIFPARINYQEANSSRLSDYLRADASVIYNFTLGSEIKATAGVSVLNFTDKNNILNTYFQINGNNVIETVESFSLGITPNFSFRLKF